MKTLQILDQIIEKIQVIVAEDYNINLTLEQIRLEQPNNQSWGDIATNVAFVISGVTKQPPLEIAKNLSYRLGEVAFELTVNDLTIKIFEKITSQAPGFINFSYSKELLLYQLINPVEFSQTLDVKTNIGLIRGKKVLFEYTDPNPFKAFHIGHLMSNAIGESLSRIFQYFGAELKRVNYQGDVGMHVSKSIWGLIQSFKNDSIDMTKLEMLPLESRIEYLGKAYSYGATKYESDDQAKKEMQEINYLVYIAAQDMLVESENWLPVVDYKKYLGEAKNFDLSQIKEIYSKGRTWSLEHFENLYRTLGTKFDGYYFESKVGEYGLNIVEEGLKTGVFERDNGAVIFRGEKYDLHTRVFVNSYGLPTYDAKDLGLASLKTESFAYDLSFIITANEINEYFKVVLKAMSLMNPELASKTKHIGHGVMRFKSGKMSSRTGDVVTGKSLINDTKEEILSLMVASNSGLEVLDREDVATKLAVGAIKYSILRQGIGKDIIFDKENAIAITGDTGPYLQYTFARANSVLSKIIDNIDADSLIIEQDSLKLSSSELVLLRNMLRFDEVVLHALNTLSPSFICDYLLNLSHNFNTFYNDSPISSSTGGVRVFRKLLTERFKYILEKGLWLLGIEAPTRV